MTETPSTNVEDHRRYFVGHGRTRRIARGVTPSVRRHVARTIDPMNLPPGARVLELGCGLGRFTEVLLGRGLHVTALDLSDYLIDSLRASFGESNRLRAVVGRAEEVDRLAPGPYDAVVGFFFLHHIEKFEPLFEAIRRVLTGRGQVAFCEPNAFNPLFYVQMTITPGMSWKGEPSVSKMRPGCMFPFLQRSGFVDLDTSVYGMLPQVISNTAAGSAIERGLDRLWTDGPVVGVPDSSRARVGDRDYGFLSSRRRARAAAASIDAA